MSQVPDVFEEQILAAAADLQTILSPGYEEDAKLIQKGLMLYRQGLVTKVRYENEAVTATVQDVTPVFVQVELTFFQTSSCSCPAEGLCRHVIATFFYAYGQIASVSDWVEQWRQPLHEKKVAEQLGLIRAKDLLKASTTIKPNYDAWMKTFQTSFQSIMKGQGLPKAYLIPELYQVLTRRTKASAPVEQEWKQLYLLISQITYFRLLLELSDECGHGNWDIERNYQQLFYSIIDQIDTSIHRLSIHALPFAFDEFIGRLKTDAIELLLVEGKLEYERTQAYQLLMSALFKKKHWREEELARIRELRKINGSFSLTVAEIHLQLLLRMDESALKSIQQQPPMIFPYLLVWLEDLKTQRDWKRMSLLIDPFLQLMRPYILSLPNSYACFDFSRHATRLLGAYCSETNRIDMYEKALISLLPYSYHEYEHLLFVEKQFQKWTDLQAYIGYGLDHISSDKIKELQKEDPSSLLPLYHQSIQKNIELKNRGNYRQAVRELKKLRTLYKKLKRQNEFEQYLQILLERTKRLRAFQEECQRGKLVHA